MKRRARRCLGVDIGSTSLKVAELSQDRTGVIVQRLMYAPLEVPPDAPADARWEAVVQTLRDLLRQHKIGTRQAVFALPGHAVFVRRVRLPRTSEERLERIIRFEARQQIPFPLEQTLLQYQICATDVEDEVEVLLVAIKREIVDHYMSLIRRLRLQPIQLGVSSFALFNFHMFDQGVEPQEFSFDQVPLPTSEEVPAEEGQGPAEKEGGKKAGGVGASLKGLFSRKAKAAAPEAEAPAAEGEAPGLGGFDEIEEVKAYVNVGASTMDLAIGRTAGSYIIGFARSIPVAGHQLTRMIKDRCNCESFAEAERIKREQTQVLLGGAQPAADRYNEQACRAIMATVDRMVAELRRSLDFYISQPDGMAVDRLVVSGGQIALSNLTPYLEERLGVPAELANEIHNPVCRINTRAETDMSNFLIAIGLALQGLGQACITVDFLPEHLKGWIAFKRKNAYLAIQVTIVAGMIFLASQIGGRMASVWEREAAKLKEDRDRFKPLMDKYQSAQTERQVMINLVFAMYRAVGMWNLYGLDRDYSLKVLAMIESVKPTDVFFREIRIGGNGELRLYGYCVQARSGPTLTQALQEMDEIEDARMQRDPNQVRIGRERYYRFLVTAKIKNKVSKIEHTPAVAGRGGYPPYRPGATPPRGRRPTPRGDEYES